MGRKFNLVLTIVLAIWCFLTVLNFTVIFQQQRKEETRIPMMANSIAEYTHNAIHHEVIAAISLLVEVKDWTVSSRIDDKIDEQLIDWTDLLVPYYQLSESKRQSHISQIQAILEAE